MKKKFGFARPWIVIALVLLSAALADPAASKEDLAGRTVLWTITNARIVDPGVTRAIAEGELTDHYTVEADAASADAPIKEGIIRITLSAFSPVKRMGRQEPGNWYVKGKWELFDKNADKKALKLKHGDALLKGRLDAELPFNPAADPGYFTAGSQLPLNLIGKHWGKASGAFYGNERFEGDLELTFERWQKVKD